MEKVSLDLTYCHGIKRLKHSFDFSEKSAFAIYAPNGVMKTSLADTFEDAALGRESRDQIFPARKSVRKISDEAGQAIEGEDRLLVVKSYSEAIGPTKKTSALLVDPELQKEYEDNLRDTVKAKEELLIELKKHTGSKIDFEDEISLAFTPSADRFDEALASKDRELADLKEPVFADVPYDTVFNEKVVDALGKKNLQERIKDYVDRYNELLEGSLFFRKGTFDYYNAEQVAKTLTANGFFRASHTVVLHANGKEVVIRDQEELTKVVDEDKARILKDKKLRDNFEAVADQLYKNVDLRRFCTYLQDNEPVLARMDNIRQFKEDVIKSYLKVLEGSYRQWLAAYDKARDRSRYIREQAEKQRTQWEDVIEIFNRRFDVPFVIGVKNKAEVMIGTDGIPQIDFTYKEPNGDSIKIEKGALLNVLSNGEKKALYILNVLFEIETRIKASQETLVIVDDLADSFDYQNKYAIIHYLKEISEDGTFKLIVMTHNFDFFRTIQSRFVGYNQSLIALKEDKGITLTVAVGFKNPFGEWKKHFYTDAKMMIASICFIRNLVEYTRDDNDPAFLTLTSLLHQKADTPSITVGDLDKIFHDVCNISGKSKDPKESVRAVIAREAKTLAAAVGHLNLESKIVLAIAIRLDAEKFMIAKIADQKFVESITSVQTPKLVERFRKDFAKEVETLKVLDRVLVMTPENIHLNSFMYEPIIDMSGDQLRRLYEAVQSLK